MTPENKSESLSSSACESWRKAARENPAEPLTEERMEAIFTASAMFGPANCWTGTTGDLCAMIRELLRERESLLATIAFLNDEQ